MSSLVNVPGHYLRKYGNLKKLVRPEFLHLKKVDLCKDYSKKIASVDLFHMKYKSNSDVSMQKMDPNFKLLLSHRLKF